VYHLVHKDNLLKTLKRTKLFVKDIRKVQFSDKHYTKFILFIGKLIEGKELPSEALDHALQGEWLHFREFHISGDLLVIYKIDEANVWLARIGSHSQLFK